MATRTFGKTKLTPEVLKVCGAHPLAHAAGYLAPAGTAVDRRGAHSLADAAGYIPQSQSVSCARPTHTGMTHSPAG